MNRRRWLLAAGARLHDIEPMFDISVRAFVMFGVFVFLRPII